MVRNRAGNRRKNRKRLSRKQKVRRMRIALIGGSVLLLFLVLLFVIFRNRSGIELNKDASTAAEALEPDFSVDLLTVNEYSRPGIPLIRVKGIVIHYTANPGSTAKDNRDYFEGLKDTHTTKASSHFIIGLDGEVIQCIPTAEISYASNDRNPDTISIECCHPDESGQFTEETYRSLVQTTAWLCAKFDLSSRDVIRHYDVTGKDCPRYFVQNEDAWKQFRRDVDDCLERGVRAVK